jgi:ribosomal protein S18 acetylase RimI-like enzyme
MSNSSLELSAIGSGEELVQAWSNYGYYPAGGIEAWVEAVDEDRNAVLIARLAKLVVGFVTIKWSGPSVREPEVTEALTAEFPNQSPIPTLYALNIHKNYRRQGIARQLMRGAEDHIVDRPGAVPRAALSVEARQVPAVSLYFSLGYQLVPYKNRGVVVLDRPTLNEEGAWVPSNEPSYIMSKDLSQLSKKPY